MGYRTSPIIDDMSNQDIYIHAIYFVTNTISHVAIGDITPISTGERAFTAFMIMIFTFFYAFLFANIASVISDFLGKDFLTFHERYQYVMSKVNLEKTPKATLQNINTYYDFLWSSS